MSFIPYGHTPAQMEIQMALTFLMLIAVSAGVEIVICVISGGPGNGGATASASEGATVADREIKVSHAR